MGVYGGLWEFIGLRGFIGFMGFAGFFFFFLPAPPSRHAGIVDRLFGLLGCSWLFRGFVRAFLGP